MKRDYCYKDGFIVHYKDGYVVDKVAIDGGACEIRSNDLTTCFLCSNDAEKYVKFKNGFDKELCSKHLETELNGEEDYQTIDIKIYIRNRNWFNMYYNTA